MCGTRNDRNRMYEYNGQAEREGKKERDLGESARWSLEL
jgi:hypothetical protein